MLSSFSGMCAARTAPGRVCVARVAPGWVCAAVALGAFTGCGDDRTAAQPGAGDADGAADTGEDLPLFREQDLEAPDTALACACGNGKCEAACSETEASCAADCKKAVVCSVAPGGSCDDGVECTTDICNAVGACVHGVAIGSCDDGDKCTTDDKCSNAKCLGQGLLKCTDGNPCTADACDAKLGCNFAPTQANCSDNSSCTTGDACIDGACVGKDKIDCSDGNPCTEDGCNQLKGCVYPPISATCTDANACTLGDMCKDGLCLPGVTTTCDDANACTTDACAKGSGCTNASKAGPCNDGSVCTKAEVCLASACTPTEMLNCDDNLGCTDDFCDAKAGCGHLTNAAPCSDGDACTATDVCQTGKCKPGAPTNCDDANACTADACAKASGCTHAANSLTCNDNDACTLADACTATVCKGGKAVNCNDGNACTDDLCDKVGKCSQVANAAACDDGDACSANDACAASACKAGAAATCQDGAKSGGETDVDCGGVAACGGPACPACGAALFCKVAADCVSGVCGGAQCAKPACDDKVQNGAELGVDCGGACAACPALVVVGTDAKKAWAATWVPGGQWKVQPLDAVSVDAAAATFDAKGDAWIALRHTQLGDPTDNQLKWAKWAGGGWTPISGVAGAKATTKSAPALAAIGAEVMVAFHGLDFKHYVAFGSGAQWQGPNPAGQPAIFGPVGASLAAQLGGVGGPGSVALGFVDGGNVNHAAVREYTKAGGWTTVTDLSGGLDFKLPVTLAATSATDPLQPDLLALHLDTGGQVHWQGRVAGKWTASAAISGAFTEGRVAVAGAGPGLATAAFRGLDSKLYVVKWNGSAWSSVGVAVSPNVTLLSPPAVCRGVAGADTELVWVGATGGVQHVRFSAGAWTKPAAVADGVTNVALGCTQSAPP
ncbi:MAG: hypothetical protein EXR79_15975 [Myxococcales bacterium]|nr:hypothetical protein [Myxococcales bacterium]